MHALSPGEALAKTPTGMRRTSTSCLADMVAESLRGPPSRAAAMTSDHDTCVVFARQQRKRCLAFMGIMKGIAARVALKSSQSDGPRRDSCGRMCGVGDGLRHA